MLTDDQKVELLRLIDCALTSTRRAEFERWMLESTINRDTGGDIGIAQLNHTNAICNERMDVRALIDYARQI